MVGCATCTFKTPKCGTKGPEDSPFVIVGESPGIMEIHKGLPFVGDSGEVINKVLAKLGYLPGSPGYIEPFYTNAIQCLPRRKDVENMTQACINCRPRLLEEIERHPRKLVLSLGSFALQSLLGIFSLKITQERGKLFPTPLSQLGLVAAVHPAFLLRGGGNYTQFERDIKYALDLVREGVIARKLPDGTTYDVLESHEEVVELNKMLAAMPAGSQVASDIETTGFNYQLDRILCAGFQYSNDRSAIVLPQHMNNELFAHKHLLYTWHNGKFDTRFLRYNKFPNARVDDDDLLLSYALNERRGIHDLDQVSSDWLGSPNHKGMMAEYYKGFVIDEVTGLKRRRNLSDAPPEKLWRYLALDLNDTYKLAPVLKPQVLKDKDLRKFYYRHLQPGSEYLVKLEMNGMLVDQEWVLVNRTRLLKICNRLEMKMNLWSRKLMGCDFNPRSWQQVKKLLYDTLKLAPNTWATDDDTLELLEQHPVVKRLREYRKQSKSYSTYVVPLIADRSIAFTAAGKLTEKEPAIYPDGRTHSNYLLHGTPTSRLACRDMNVQNIPRDPILRGQFMARPGYMILEVDYSQAELRSLAALSKCAALMGIYLNDLNLHNELTVFLFGENWTREHKMAAKTVNFGIPYGREAPSIASDVDLNKGRKVPITVAEAQGWIDGWAARFPGAWEFIQQCRNAPLLGQTITTCFGNKKRPGVVSREKLRNLANESANFPHQSIASNLTIRSGIELFDTLRDDYDTHIGNTVHDCIVMETPANKDSILEVTKVVMDKMEEIPTRFKALNIIPFKAEAEIGWHWGNLVSLADVEKKYKWDLNAIPNYIPAH